MPPIIYTTGVSREFRTGGGVVHALRNVSINVQPNVLTVLRGRSGSGKTTLMNMLGALDRPTNGDVFVDGMMITEISDAKRDNLRRKSLGFIFQSVALISMMSAYENVEFALRLANYPSAERKARAEECLSHVGLYKRMKHRPAELSGGEQQRVAIARAICHRPKIVFADEPTAELDTAMALQVVKLFKSIIEKEGVTVVMTTHDPEMMDIADHVYTLQDGEVVDER